MRPKRRILLVDANEFRRDIRAFVLETHGFAVHVTSDYRGAWALCRRHNFDVAVLVRKSVQTEQYMRFPGSPPLLAISAGRPQAKKSTANAVMLVTDTSAELLWRVKTLASHKRGPKPRAIPEAQAV